MRPETAPTLVTEAIAELIALAAAMASNNEEAFQRHNFRLHKLDVSREDRIQAVNIALQVKMAPHRSLVEMAESFLVGGAKPGGGCCGGDSEGGCCGGDSEEGCCGGDCECAGEGEASACGDQGCGCGH